MGFRFPAPAATTTGRCAIMSLDGSGMQIITDCAATVVSSRTMTNPHAESRQHPLAGMPDLFAESLVRKHRAQRGQITARSVPSAGTRTTKWLEPVALAEGNVQDEVEQQDGGS